MRMFLVVGLLCCFTMTFGVPADLKCLGKNGQNGQIHFIISPDITEEIHDCEAQWIFNETLIALYDGNRNTSVMAPIISATANTAIMEVGSDNIKYILNCPDINVHRRLTCSYSTPDYTATRDPPLRNETFAEDSTDGGFPKWWITLTVIAGIVFLSGIIILVRKVTRRCSGYDLADGEKPV